MIDLFTAIDTHYRTDPLANGLKDMHHTEAPPDAEFPYGVCSLVSVVPDWTFTENFENCLLQFNLFSRERSSQEICNLYELLKGDTVSGTGFDFLELSLDNYETVILERENATLLRIEKVWQYNVTYRILLEYSGIAAHAIANLYLYNLLSL